MLHQISISEGVHVSGEFGAEISFSGSISEFSAAPLLFLYVGDVAAWAWAIFEILFIRSPGSRMKRPRSSSLPWFILGRMSRKYSGTTTSFFDRTTSLARCSRQFYPEGNELSVSFAIHYRLLSCIGGGPSRGFLDFRFWKTI